MPASLWVVCQDRQDICNEEWFTRKAETVGRKVLDSLRLDEGAGLGLPTRLEVKTLAEPLPAASGGEAAWDFDNQKKVDERLVACTEA